AVTDPRDGRRVALKKLPNVFQSLVSSKRVFRELKMLCFFKHDNVLSALDILQPPHLDFFQEMYPFLNTRTRPLRRGETNFSRLKSRAGGFPLASNDRT
ncbi:Serine/threonine kinase NLK, partial [Harpegnathos saltator]